MSLIEYDTINAIEWLSNFQKPCGCSDFVIIKADDGKEYQVKFNLSNSREFISHYIASLIGVPVPPAKIVYISNHILSSISKSLTNIASLPTEYYFAIEWNYNTVQWETYDEFLDELRHVHNFKSFLSIFPYDQYLKNRDRHQNNHIILYDKKWLKFYNSIDSDKIFAGLAYEDILSVLNDYNCVYEISYGDVLYDCVIDEEFDDVLRHAVNIDKHISKDHIADIVNICSELYGSEDMNYHNLETFLLERKDKIYDACTNNIECYSKAKRNLLCQ